MKLGAERKKVVFLSALAVAAAYLLYTNVFSTPSSAARTRVSLPPVPQAMPLPAVTTPGAASRPGTAASRRTTSEFRPSFKTKDLDPSTVDPKLRLDLLAKVQGVDVGPAQRNLFQFGVAAAPAIVKEPRKIIPLTQEQIAQQQALLNPGPPQPPPPPPITLKYYGYAAQRADGRKRAFFLDGDDIFVAAEGELIKRRYKVVRIGVSSVEVEDTQFNHTQPLPLAEEAPPG
jgi:hypothetical protein